MPSEDSHRVNLQLTAASIKAWSGFVADVARLEIVEATDHCRVTMVPVVSGGCPVDLVIDGSALRCTGRIGAHDLPGWELPSLDLVLPLLKAVAEGHVVTRHTVSCATGLPLEIGTLVRLEDGSTLTIQGTRSTTPSRPMDAPMESRETHFLPYRKPAG